MNVWIYPLNLSNFFEPSTQKSPARTQPTKSHNIRVRVGTKWSLKPAKKWVRSIASGPELRSQCDNFVLFTYMQCKQPWSREERLCSLNNWRRLKEAKTSDPRQSMHVNSLLPTRIKPILTSTVIFLNVAIKYECDYVLIHKMLTHQN